MMRAGETEDAVRARPGCGIAGGRIRHVLRVVLAKFESRNSDIGARRNRQAEGDQQRLRGDGKSGDGGDQWPPRTPGTPANRADAEHVMSDQHHVIIGTSDSKVNARDQSSTPNGGAVSATRFTSAACA